jgi:hypothetical protein
MIMSIKFEELFKYRDESNLNAAGGQTPLQCKKSLWRSDFSPSAGFDSPSLFAKR